VNVSISVSLGRQLVVPASSVLQTGTRQIAFLDHGDGYLEPREIQAGLRFDDHIVVLKGLNAGDRIVSSANFLVDSEAQLQAALSSFAPPPPGASAAAAMNGSAEQAAIEFNSEPSPPRKGSNTLRVTLKDAQGKPVLQAQLKVTFYMPAMPAMGMAATNKSAALTDGGNGTYEGSVELPSGGSYQVTITAVKDGKILGSKHLNVTVTGGM